MDMNRLVIDRDATNHFQEGVLDAIAKLRADIPVRENTRDGLIEMVMSFNQSHAIDTAECMHLACEGKLEDAKRYRWNMMVAIVGVLLGALAECALDNNTQWDSDDLFVAQFWNQVNNAAKRIRAAECAP